MGLTQNNTMLSLILALNGAPVADVNAQSKPESYLTRLHKSASGNAQAKMDDILAGYGTLVKDYTGRSEAGDALAAKSLRIARSGRYKEHQCYKAVKDAIWQIAKVKLNGGSACMAPDSLLKSGKFIEKKINTKNLSKEEKLEILRDQPPGTVIVWNRLGNYGTDDWKTHGHTAISQGDGDETDWDKRPIVIFPTTFRLFYLDPKKIKIGKK